MIDPSFALYAWFVFAYFYFKRKLPVWGLSKTTVVCMILGILLLPANFLVKPPTLPSVSKELVAVIAPYFALLLTARETWKARGSASGMRYPMILMTLGMIGTIVTNGDDVVQGVLRIPAQNLADFRVGVLWFLPMLWLPFAFGERLIQTPDELKMLCRMVVASLVWCWLPLLFEMRISPQLHLWLYGYYAFDFVQAIREGGFRPALLTNHGLTMAMYQFAALVLAMGLYRSKVKTMGMSGLTIYVIGLAILAMCNSKGAMMYALVFPPLLLFTGSRVHVAVAWTLVLLALFYPFLRASEVVPVDEILDWATEKFGPERTQSLEFRFDNEWILLERAMKRPWFGWGTGGRALLYKPWDGTQLTIPDGAWIIWVGSTGLIGYVTYMLTYLLALWSWTANHKRFDPRDAPLMSALGLVVAAYAFDQIPNSLNDRLPILYCGVLFSLSRLLPVYRARERQAQMAALHEQQASQAEATRLPAQGEPVYY